MKTSFFVLPLILLPATAEVIVSYEAGVPATASETGAANPATQGWTFTGPASPNQYAAGYDSGNGGWRTVDGTSTAPANYSRTLDAAAQAKLVAGTTWTIEWTVALDKDALGSAGGTVTDYYLGRTDDNIVVLVDLAAGGLGYYLTLQVDASNQFVINDNSGGSGTYNTGLDVTAFPGFGTFSLTHDTTAGTATLDYGAGTVTLTPGTPLIGGRNAVFFGAGSSGGQGSAVWNAVTVRVPDPVPGDQLTWTGLTDGTWDSLTSNWALADSSPATFTDGDDVTLDDSASTGIITVAGTHQPGSILVDNDTLAYSIGGDPLTGFATLTKQGPGSLTLISNLDTLGGTTLTAGSITAGDGATAGEIGGGGLSLAAGTTLTVSRSDLLDYKATPKFRTVSGEGGLVLDGGGTLFSYPGGGLGFNSADTWAGFSGPITITNGSTLQTIRNGATALGSGTITLGETGTTSGNLAQIEGNWTWINPIIAAGPDNRILNNSAPGAAGRFLKLQGALSGTGNLTLEDTTGAMSDPNLGFIITSDLALDNPLRIATGTPVRIGGLPGEDVGIGASSSGSLGTTHVANEGILTFSRTDAHSVANAITGSGRVRIGIPSAAGPGDTSTQVVTFSTSQAYTGFTVVESGTLVLPAPVSLASSVTVVEPEGTLAGNGSVALDLDVSGTVAPGESTGTLAAGGILALLDDATYAWEIKTWGGSAPGTSHDHLTADTIDIFALTSNPVTITVSPDSLDGVSGFGESNQTYVIATAATDLRNFDPAAFVVDDGAFAAATGSAGTWDVQLSADSLSIELVYTPGVPGGYAQWIDGIFPGEDDPAVIGFDADPDGDGIGNGVENFLGTAPDEFSAGLTITGSTAASVTATHSRSNDPANDIAGDYEWSSDLATWHTSGATDGNGVTATISSVLIDDRDSPLNDTVEVTAAITGGPGARIFLRTVAFRAVP